LDTEVRHPEVGTQSELPDSVPPEASAKDQPRADNGRGQEHRRYKELERRVLGKRVGPYTLGEAWDMFVKDLSAQKPCEQTLLEPYENEPAEQEFERAELTERQHKALYVILSGGTNTAAAKVAGVSRRTVCRWRQMPAFEAELHMLQNAFANQVQAELAPLADEAVAVVQEALERHNVPAALELLKANHILSGEPKQGIHGVDAFVNQHPATVFPLPAACQAAAATQPPDAAPAAEAIRATAEPVKPQTREFQPTLADLLPPQQLAIAELLAGKPNAAVVQAVGVSLKTLMTWQQEPVFRQVLRICRQEAQLRVRTRLLNMSQRAIGVLRHALREQRDVRAALAILRGLGLLGRES
jgi:DNA-binding NarL/FixJ family response regulator